MLRSKLIVCEELKDQLNDLTSAKERLSHEVNDLRRENSRSVKITCLKVLAFNFRYPIKHVSPTAIMVQMVEMLKTHNKNRLHSWGGNLEIFLRLFLQVGTDRTQVHRPSRSVLTARASVRPQPRDVILICSSLTSVGYVAALVQTWECEEDDWGFEKREECHAGDARHAEATQQHAQATTWRVSDVTTRHIKRTFMFYIVVLFLLLCRATQQLTEMEDERKHLSKQVKERDVKLTGAPTEEMCTTLVVHRCISPMFWFL